MSDHIDLLVEIGTEELPPKALKTLSEAFTSALIKGLQEAGLAAQQVSSYATPRRLAVYLQSVPSQQATQMIEKRGPAVKAAFDAEGNPSKAAQGFARSCGVEVSDLQHMETDKGAWLVFRQQQSGEQTTQLLPNLVEKALAALPIPKRMRWGDGDAEFVRPVHWVVLLADEQVIEANIMGIASGAKSYGHRFHAPEPLHITHPANYSEQLKAAYVVASFAERREFIRERVHALATQLGGQAIMPETLLDEVAALVEWPVPVAGRFDERFLDIPQEALIYTMQGDQKYFGVTDSQGHLMPAFITVSNIESSNPANVSAGNERVIRPRFSDAAFFWEQDRKQTLASRREALKSVVFQQQLGSVFDKSERVAALATMIAEQLNADTALAQRAAELGKCDLITNMVFEFTDLQGTMGRYYARHDGEADEVAEALAEQYLPRYAGDELPKTNSGRILALAERIDTLVGIFAIGQKPTGTKDPFGLRRAALGVLRILIEQKLPLDLAQLCEAAATRLTEALGKAPDTGDVLEYCFERLRGYYQDQEIAPEFVEAVLALKPTSPLDFDQRLQAVSVFRALTASESLAAANKRISNLLKKVDGELPEQIDENLLELPAEQTLWQAMQQQDAIVQPLFAEGDYKTALLALSQLRDPVDQFFDDVMVMTDDQALRQNRLAVLNRLRGLFLRVADLSVL